MPIREQQKTNTQHAVPQNIMEVEFKLIGDLTMRQFVYIVAFALMAYMAKLTVPAPFTWVFVIGIVLLGLALAFVPIEDRGLDEWLVNFIKAINSDTEKVWKKETRLPQAFSYDQQLAVLQKELITLTPTTSRRRLEEFLEKEIDRDEEDPLDIPEKEYAEKIHDAYAKFALEMQSPEESPEEDQQNITEPGKPQPPDIKVSPQEKASEEKEGKPQTQIRKSEKEDYQKTEGQAQKRRPHQTDKMSKIIRSRINQAKIHLPEEPSLRRTPKLQPITSHAGRRFVNLTPTQGQIVLPIRGERILQTEKEIAEEYRDKTEKLNKLLNQKGDSSGDTNTIKPKFVKQVPSMVNKPNIISGVIKNRRGEHLENVILVVKNEKGEAVRALKTNKLGNFLLSSPLPKGEYQIEIDKNNDTGLTFDIIPLSVNEGLLPSLEIIGH